MGAAVCCTALCCVLHCAAVFYAVWCVELMVMLTGTHGSRVELAFCAYLSVVVHDVLQLPLKEEVCTTYTQRNSKRVRGEAHVKRSKNKKKKGERNGCERKDPAVRMCGTKRMP